MTEGSLDRMNTLGLPQLEVSLHRWHIGDPDWSLMENSNDDLVTPEGGETPAECEGRGPMRL